MKYLISISAILMMIGSCQAHNKKETSNPGYSNGRKDSMNNPRYESILKGLSKNYVLNIAADNKIDLLRFYNRTDSAFEKDSTEYHRSVKDFYNCDSLILTYLLVNYKGDTSACFWVYSHHPHSSTIKKWEFGFTKEEGAAVLIYDYFVNDPGSRGHAITTSPGEIEKIIGQVNLDMIGKWMEKNANLRFSEMKKEFIKQFKV